MLDSYKEEDKIQEILISLYFKSEQIEPNPWQIDDDNDDN